jgi:membrane-associated phospholipid phosphatase
MNDIFISYSRNDRPRAEIIAGGLAAAGWSVWWDRSIPAGKEFDEVIEGALNDSKLVIVLWSHHAVASRWVLTEAGEAADREILMPVLIERKVKIPFAFKRIQAADLAEWDGDVQAPSFRTLVADITARIGIGRTVSDPSANRDKVLGEGAGGALAAQQTERENHSGSVAGPEGRDLLLPSHSRWLDTRLGLTWLLAAVFGVNYVETAIETVVRDRFGWGVDLGNRLAAAFRGLEGNLSFESHDLTNWLAVYGYSVAYVFFLPILGLGVAAVLWRRKDVRAYRILCVSVAADYLFSLGFFLFFPIPERWSYADSGAMLLSDRWSSRLIELVRPMSAMDNCFPSTHVSLTIVLILVSYVAGLRFRHTICALGTSVILSTFVLGIHWLPDIVAGMAVGVLSVALARYRKPRRTTAILHAVPAIGGATVLQPQPDRMGALAHS